MSRPFSRVCRSHIDISPTQVVIMCVCVYNPKALQREFVRPNSRRVENERKVQRKANQRKGSQEAGLGEGNEQQGKGQNQQEKVQVKRQEPDQKG